MAKVRCIGVRMRSPLDVKQERAGTQRSRPQSVRNKHPRVCWQAARDGNSATSPMLGIFQIHLDHEAEENVNPMRLTVGKGGS